MLTRVLQAALTLGLVPAIYGQIYLITGAPGIEFPMTLVQVANDGSVKPPVELLSPYFLSGVKWPAPPLEWFSVSYDWRKALIFPTNAEEPLMVLDLDKAAVVKRCKIPQSPGMALITQWLADVPGRGPTFEWLVVGNDITHPITQGMIMDPAVPCEESFLIVEPSEITYLVAHGSAGVAGLDASDGTYVSIAKDGTIQRGISTTFSFNYRLPSELLKTFDRPYADIVVNTSQVLVISLLQEKMGTPLFYAYRKRDESWHRIPVQSDWYHRLRGFENYVAVVEGRLKKNIAKQKDKGVIRMGLKDEPGDDSAGSEKWRKAPSATGPDIAASFIQAAAVYPGKLHLYDVDSGQLYTIATHQADSEILFVENKIVYYRINDQLYSAPIGEKGIGTASLLATAELIRDAHWAFIKH